MMRNIVIFYAGLIALALHITSCSSTKLMRRSAAQLLNKTELKNAHVGISIYDVTSGRSIYSYQSDKYFIPASNTKIFTLFAGMKYLGDSLPGIAYKESRDSFFISPTGDPTLLHADFPKQPVIEKLRQTSKAILIVNKRWEEKPLGFGWSWDDYNSSYMAERSALPVYGNLINWVQVTERSMNPVSKDSTQTYIYSAPDINWKVRFLEDDSNKIFSVQRRQHENYFEIRQGTEKRREQQVPFITNGVTSALELLKDTINKEILVSPLAGIQMDQVMYSQPSDQMFKTMMYRSDNFFAEQTLLMVSQQKLGIMNAAKMIDTLLKSDLQGLPQPPRWVDGSGLSRYNLFSPDDFVWILKKMGNDFGMERMKSLLPTGNTGTLTGYYRQDSGYIYAKTGTITANLALSGYLVTTGNKLLIFSILINNHQASAVNIRQSIEQFLMNLRRGRVADRRN